MAQFLIALVVSGLTTYVVAILAAILLLAADPKGKLGYLMPIILLIAMGATIWASFAVGGVYAALGALVGNVILAGWKRMR